MPGYERTPLIALSGLAAESGVRNLWVKDESSRFGLPSFKVLGASWAIYQLLRERINGGPVESLEALKQRVAASEQLTFVAATDGNHGRAVARVGRILGCEARIFVPAAMSEARIEAIQSEGAAVVLVEGDYDLAVTTAAGEADETTIVVSDTAWPGYEAIPRWIIEGYSTIFWEIEEQLAGLRDLPSLVVMVQAGVGALCAAAVLHYRALRPQGVRIITVEPEDAACVFESIRAGRRAVVSGPHTSAMVGLNCGTPSLISFPYLLDGVDACLAVEDDWAFEAMRKLGRNGIVSGETGAAGLAGLLVLASTDKGRLAREELSIDGEASVLVLSTEGATDPDSYSRIVEGAA